MARYEAEFVIFKKCIIEADSLEEANDKADMMESEEIERTETENTGCVVINEIKEVK